MVTINLIKIELKCQLWASNFNWSVQKMFFRHIPLRLAISRVYDETHAADICFKLPSEKIGYTFHQIGLNTPIYGQSVPGSQFIKIPYTEIIPGPTFEEACLKTENQGAYEQQNVAYRYLCVKRKDLKAFIKIWKKKLPREKDMPE